MADWSDSDAAFYHGDAVTVFHADNARQYSWVTRDSDSENFVVHNDDLVYTGINYNVGDQIKILGSDGSSQYECLNIVDSKTWLIANVGGSGSPFVDHSKRYELA